MKARAKERLMGRELLSGANGLCTTFDQMSRAVQSNEAIFAYYWPVYDEPHKTRQIRNAQDLEALRRETPFIPGVSPRFFGLKVR